MISTKTKKSIRVLYLDDEENNLQSFTAAFRREYTVYTASTSEDAFKLIKEHNPHVIFSDQRMPITTGVEFFNAVRQVFPEPVRILITGYTDVNDIIDAINKGHIYRYITKPWSEHEIRVAIDNAYDLFVTRKTLDEKIVQLEKSNHELSRFIYSASHDLRAPLATGLGVIQVAEHEVKDELSLDYFHKIKGSVQRLDSFVMSIIDYYKNSRQEEVIDGIDFQHLLNEIIEEEVYMHDSNAKVELVVDQEAKFIGDFFRFRIILAHLLNNAVKFKKLDQESAKIRIDCVTDSEKVSIRIQDQGSGILSEHLKKVFQMFFKSSDKRAGSGLGLYIVKEALNKMNGTIEVDSNLKTGTVFHLQVPNKA